MALKTAAEFIAEAQKSISCVDAQKALDIYRNSRNPVILDVREAHSAAESKLNDSINISRGLLEMKIAKTCPDPETVILVHCGGGGRASLSAATLQSMGYTNVHAITAPFDEIKSLFG